jgi:hypothetical protein
MTPRKPNSDHRKALELRIARPIQFARAPQNRPETFAFPPRKNRGSPILLVTPEDIRAVPIARRNVNRQGISARWPNQFKQRSRRRNLRPQSRELRPEFCRRIGNGLINSPPRLSRFIRCNPLQ